LPPDARKKSKYYNKVAAELTPLAKAMATEMANKVAYDGIQVHGGTGFMRDFAAERYYRDARITNIYEGTTQLQYIAAIGGVVQRVLEPIFTELSHLKYEGKLRRLASLVDVALAKLHRAIDYVQARDDKAYFDLMAGRLCQAEITILASYLMLRDALADKSREGLAERYVLDALPQAELGCDIVMRGDLSMIDGHQEILEM